jgi:hypothetical protein
LLPLSAFGSNFCIVAYVVCLPLASHFAFSVCNRLQLLVWYLLLLLLNTKIHTLVCIRKKNKKNSIFDVTKLWQKLVTYLQI